MISINPVELARLVHEIVEMRTEKGFHVTTKENLPVKLMCINCEIVELEEAFSKSYSTIHLELADVAMYAMAAAYDMRGRLALRHAQEKPGSWANPPEVLCAPMRRYAALSMEHWRRGEISDATLSVELVVLEAQKLAEKLDIDLVGAIQTKIEINRQRPHTHGGKHPDS